MNHIPVYEAYAVKMGSTNRDAKSNFLWSEDIHDTQMPLDYFIWVLKSEDHIVVVDTAFSTESGNRRNRVLDVTPEAAVQALGIHPDEVDDLILTHLHYDHAGGLNCFPQAPIHIQETEVSYATGKYMTHKSLNHFFEIDDVTSLIHNVYAGRVRFHDGVGNLSTGLSVHRIGGHTDGLQAVRVHTQRGWVVLASDALHYYRNFIEKNPFPAIFNVGDMLEGYEKLLMLADSENHIIPGHDPQVLENYPNIQNDLTAIAALHQTPVKS